MTKMTKMTIFPAICLKKLLRAFLRAFLKE